MTEVTTEVLSKKTLYTHGTIGMPLAVIGYPLTPARHKRLQERLAANGAS